MITGFTAQGSGAGGDVRRTRGQNLRRILILFATRQGQTAKVARRIGGHLEAAGLDVALVDAADAEATGNIGIESYDRLVFGASMHAGGLEEELVRYVNANAAAISAKPRSLFIVLLSAATRDPELRVKWLADARAKMRRQLQVEFEDVEMVAGALTYSKYPLPLKWVMRRIARQAGEDTDMGRDYEYTNWAQVEQYAQRIAATVSGVD